MTGQARQLWLMPVEEQTAAIAAYGLSTAARLPERPLDQRAWDDLRMWVGIERVNGFLSQAIADGVFPATAEQAAAAYERHTQAAAMCVVLERRLLRVATLFDECGIPFRVLKGAAVAHSAYPDPGLRTFGDVDLLVPSEAFDDALAALVNAGARRRYDQPRPGFDRRFSKGACVVDRDNLEIDVHRTFVSGPFGFAVDLDALFQRVDHVELADRRLPTLELTDRFLHACFHSALGFWPPRLVPLRDVAQFLALDGLDADRVIERAESWGIAIVVVEALLLARDGLRLVDDHPLLRWASEYTPTGRERRTLALYQGETRSYKRQALATVTAIPGVSAKFAYLKALAFPDQSYLANREGGYLRRWLRSAGVLMGRKRR